MSPWRQVNCFVKINLAVHSPQHLSWLVLHYQSFQQLDLSPQLLQCIIDQSTINSTIHLYKVRKTMNMIKYTEGPGRHVVTLPLKWFFCMCVYIVKSKFFDTKVNNDSCYVSPCSDCSLYSLGFDHLSTPSCQNRTQHIKRIFHAQTACD